MTEFIKSQISDEIFFKISELENEKNKSKQNKIAKEIISELDIEDFRPYMAYDLEGNAFIALNYYYSHNGIDECLMTGNHDATITEDGVYIDDESFLETLKIGYLREELLKEEIKGHLDQKEYDKVSDDLEFYNNHLIQLINFERPKYVGNFQKITEIDKEIEILEQKISDLEIKLENLN
ncbi:hypothetical protein [Aliarcobacter cryaerophilus]|uniref:hypothetical protein n=1 Tax=Aliarcobacter cryaerophilus TaxID=28198 RepID=UPI00112F7938|nr:hypothetical protein [Aliarcobacter cryaerophilus]